MSLQQLEAVDRLDHPDKSVATMLQHKRLGGFASSKRCRFSN
jgi:hypothetical protein